MFFPTQRGDDFLLCTLPETNSSPLFKWMVGRFPIEIVPFQGQRAVSFECKIRASLDDFWKFTMEPKQALGFGGLDLIPTSRWETHGEVQGRRFVAKVFFLGGGEPFLGSPLWVLRLKENIL